MKSIKKAFSFLLSVIVISVSVLILIIISLISLCINSLLFILMICGLSLPVAGNMLANKIPGKKI